MTISFKNALITTGLIWCLGNAAVVGASNSSGEAPMATASETVSSFREIPDLERAFVDTAPTVMADKLSVGTLGKFGGDREAVLKLAKEIADGQHNNIDSLLIVHRSELVFESYFSRGRIDLPHFQASTTKSYTSLAIGRAIQLGYLTMADLNRPVASFLNDLDPSKFANGADVVTLHDALTMSSGLSFAEGEMDRFDAEPMLSLKQRQVQTFFENTAPITPETQIFAYKGADPRLVMQVLESVVPGSAEEFIRIELFGKLGITNFSWRTDTSGLPNGPSGANVTSRDMVKVGLLARNGGRWNGEQLIPEEFIKKSTNSIVCDGAAAEVFWASETVTNACYGYYWWQADMRVGDKTYATRSAQGGGAQYIILVDELDLMIVTTGHKRPDDTMQLTAERIIPAFTAE